LLFALRRYDSKLPIASISLIDKWEAAKSIHKDNAREIFFLRQFKSIRPSNNEMEQLTTFVDDDFHAKNSSLVKLCQYCQFIRNQYLKSNCHGEEFLVADTGDDPVPKKIMRCAAACAAFERDHERHPDDLDSVDTLEGLQFISAVLEERKESDDPEVKDLRRWLAVARNGRGTERPMSNDQLLLLSELVLDRALRSIVRSEADVVGAAIERFSPTKSS